MALSMYWWPSVAVPAIATNKESRFTFRESRTTEEMAMCMEPNVASRFTLYNMSLSNFISAEGEYDSVSFVKLLTGYNALTLHDSYTQYFYNYAVVLQEK